MVDLGSLHVSTGFVSDKADESVINIHLHDELVAVQLFLVDHDAIDQCVQHLRGHFCDVGIALDDLRKTMHAAEGLLLSEECVLQNAKIGLQLLLLFLVTFGHLLKAFKGDPSECAVFIKAF